MEGNEVLKPPLIRGLVLFAVIFCIGFLLGQLSTSSLRRSVNPTKGKRAVEVIPEGADGAQTIAQLAALGYTAGYRDPRAEIRGVEVFDRDLASPGLNFYSSRPQSRAQLIDMDGNEVYRWQFDEGVDGWQHAEVLADGGLLVVIKDEAVLRLESHSKLLWRHITPAHHDLAVADDGSIFVLSRRRVERPELSPDAPILEDFIEVLSPEGDLLRSFSVLDALLDSPFAFLLPSIKGLPLGTVAPDDAQGLVVDVLHSNHVEVLDGGEVDRSPIFGRGNLLVSMRTINTIAVIDGRTERVVWAWGPNNLTRQHHPRLLDSGNILLFDNGRRRSQIIELDPLNNEVVWRYAPRTGFLSQTRGSVQRLPNGNTLITESDKGYVFEVTPDARMVWRFANPDVNDTGVRAPIWRMTRYPRDELPFLDEPL